MERPERLKVARIKAGFPSASAAARALDIGVSTYTHHENGTRDFSDDDAGVYARRFKVPVEWLYFGRGPSPFGGQEGTSQKEELSVVADPLVAIPVVGFVQGGYWAEPDEDRTPDEPPVRVPLPEIYKAFRKFALKVEGNSMNLVYPHGTTLICASLYDLHEEEPIGGKKYIVQRRQPDGRIETTVKELQADVYGKWWLWPRSNDPEHQAPIPYDAVDGDEISVQARVLFALLAQ